MADIQATIAEKLSDYNARLQAAATGREHAQAARNLLQALVAQDERVDLFNALREDTAVDVAELPKLDDAQREWLSTLSNSASESDELKALKAEVEGILSIAGPDSVLQLPDSIIEEATELVAIHKLTFVAHEAGESRRRGRRARQRVEGESEDFDPSRRLGGHMRVTFPDWTGKSPRNSYIGDWGSIRYDWNVGTDWKIAPAELDAILPKLQDAQKSGEPIVPIVVQDSNGGSSTLEYSPSGDIA